MATSAPADAVIRHILAGVAHFATVGAIAYATIAGVSVAACQIA